MLILQYRQFPEKGWFINKRKIVNWQEITNISHAVVANEPKPMADSGKDIVIMVETYEEFKEQLETLYCVVFRLYTNFRRDTRYIWVNEEADLDWINKLYGKDKIFLGHWDLPKWSKVRDEIRFNCNRRLLVKKEWIELRYLELVSEGLIV